MGIGMGGGTGGMSRAASRLAMARWTFLLGIRR